MTTNLTDPQAPVTDEELDQMIWKLERDGGMTPKLLSLMRELREVRRARVVTSTNVAVSETNLAATQIKPVADLYGITSPTGSETTFTFDAGEASRFADSGWTVQEYVELERYQEAMVGNSPATPDGWIPVSERMPEHKTGVIVAFEMDGPGDWRMKWASYIPEHPDSINGWLIPGASWTPTHWQPLPEPPKEVG